MCIYIYQIHDCKKLIEMTNTTVECILDISKHYMWFINQLMAGHHFVAVELL